MKYFATLSANNGLNGLPHNPCRLLGFDLLKLPAGESISGKTGDREVLAVIDRAKYDVRPIGITRGGAWVVETAEWPELEPGTLPAVRDDLPPFLWESLLEVDAAFPLLHGGVGEDGGLQQVLTLLDAALADAGDDCLHVTIDGRYRTQFLLKPAGGDEIRAEVEALLNGKHAKPAQTNLTDPDQAIPEEEEQEA